MATEGVICIGLFIAVFSLSFLAEGVWIPILKKYRAAQPILEIGPSWHVAKAGTPTMGGAAFALSVVLCLPIFVVVCGRWMRSYELYLVCAVVLYAFCCGAVGFLDDYCKLRNRRNQGLTASGKYFLLLTVSAAFLVAMRLGGVTTVIRVPFWKGTVELGVYYYPLALLFLTGVVNAANLTDGLDGLLATTVSVLGAFYVVYGLRGNAFPLSVIGAVITGAALGFLPYNAHPAKVFMGDTGSLFLGGLIAGGGLLAAVPLTTLLAGGVYVTEAASVILQVLYFKLSGGKRLFKMAPIHHHFEKCGFSEWQIVLLFAVCGLAFGVLAYLGG